MLLVSHCPSIIEHWWRIIGPYKVKLLTVIVSIVWRNFEVIFCLLQVTLNVITVTEINYIRPLFWQQYQGEVIVNNRYHPYSITSQVDKENDLPVVTRNDFDVGLFNINVLVVPLQSRWYSNDFYWPATGDSYMGRYLSWALTFTTTNWNEELTRNGY